MNYIYGLDLSLSNSGVFICDEDGNPIKAISIPTDKKLNHQERLKIIGDTLLELRKEFPTCLIAFESGFSRHAASTEALFKTIGLVQYLFADCQQFSYAPSSIKKTITGSGRADKDLVREVISKRYPDLIFKNNDESDACATITCHLLRHDMIKS